MNAEQMFKKLGYKQVRNDGCLIKYEQFIHGNCIQITFTLLLKKVIATYGYQTSSSYAHDITSDEFKAIVQQEKELGWLEEEQKQETNFEHYFEHLSKLKMSDFALIDGRFTKCSDTSCSECYFNGDCIEGKFRWLKQPYKKPVYKLTKFEIDLLQSYPDTNSFKLFNSLNMMKEKGYFKNVDKNELIKDILAKCEVV